ncbi:hypothetical protein [Thermogutta terrifontis]|nr:hypothetical protein [Thermogutta terrifontis]
MLLRRICLALVIGLMVGGKASEALSQESDIHRRFLEALKLRGYFDTAVEYLDMLAGDPSCPPELKEMIDYEAGKALLGAAQASRVAQTREQLLTAAVARLKKFVQEHPQHPAVPEATAEMAQALIERAKGLLATTEGKSDQEAEPARMEARKLIEQARQEFEVFKKAAYDRAKEFENKVIDRANAALVKERDEARATYLKSLIYSVGALYQLAQTYPPSSKERSDLLKQAAAEYEKIFNKYQNYAAGIYARFYEGICYQELGQDMQAADIFKETLTVPGDSPEVQRLRTEALARLIQIYRKNNNHQAAVEAAVQWEESVRPDVRDSEWGLNLLYEAALSALELAQAADKAKDARSAQQHRATARRFLEIVSRAPGPRRLDAQSKLAELTGVQENLSVQDVQTYADAKARGELAWGRFLGLMAQLQKGEGDAKQLRDEATKARDLAITFYRKALGLYKNQPLEEVNLMRFQMVFLLWDAGRYEDAAVLGEFLARRYPQSAGSQKAAEIAVKALRNLFIEARKHGQPADAELSQMQSLAEYVLSQWPDQPESGECVLTLLESFLDLDQLEEAKAFLNRLPENSPSRARAELRIGQVLWMQYAKAATGREEGTAQADTQALLADAQKYLEQGVQRIRANTQGVTVDYFLEYSVWLLAQLYVNTGRTDDAIKPLEDPTIGPLALMRSNHSAVSLPKFKEEILKTALRAYVGAQNLEKAFQIRDELEKLVAGSNDAEATRRLTLVYVGLGRQLEEQLTRLRNEGKTEEVDKVLKGFTAFLEAIQERSESVDFRALNWVAETFLGLAKGLDPGGPTVPEQAKEYYTKAMRTYLELIDKCQKDPQFGPPDATTALKVRLASALRGLRLYDKALAIIINVIDKEGKENRLDAQLEAAQIYQEWAEQPGKEEYYEYAIRGGYEKNGRYLIWGWGGIARRVAVNYAKYQDIFHQARYNLALCRFKLAQKQTGPKRQELLKQAVLDIQRTYLLYPEMGGKEWYARYDKLARTIQQMLGEKSPQGLRAFEGETKAKTTAS